MDCDDNVSQMPFFIGSRTFPVDAMNELQAKEVDPRTEALAMADEALLPIRLAQFRAEPLRTSRPAPGFPHPSIPLQPRT